MPKILTVGYHDREAPRQWTIEKQLRTEGYAIVACHTEKRGLLGKYADLHRQFREKASDADTVLVTFPGQYVMPLVWWLTRFPRRRVLFDAFVSLYDSMVLDRRLVSPWHPYAWFLWLMDYVSCHMADEILMDTETHKQYFARMFHLDPKRIRVIYLGSRSDLFVPATSYKLQATGFHVLFYGTYIPLQGVTHILDAAMIVERKNPHVTFTLVGSGQEYAQMKKKAERLGLRNTHFHPFVPLRALPALLQGADLCLGIFGKTPKAQRVIPHKVYDAVACGIPVLTQDSPAIRERFADRTDVLLCPPGDPAAMATKILAQAAMESRA